MRSLVYVLALVAGPALAQDSAPAPDAPASAPGHAEFSQLQCSREGISFHFRGDGYTEGRVKIPMEALNRACRAAQEQEDAPQPQRMPKQPLPKADNV